MKLLKKAKAKKTQKMDINTDKIEEISELFRQIVKLTQDKAQPGPSAPAPESKETFFLNFKEDEDPRNFFKQESNELDPSIAKL